jgi:FkbM family methyltransferase
LARAIALVEHHCGSIRDRVFVDVGANIGTTSIVAARQFGFRRVVAVEPEPDNFKLLAINRVANGLGERMDCVNAALSDREGELQLRLHPRNFGAHWVMTNLGAEPAPEGKEARTVPVVGTTLRTLLDRHGIAARELGLVWMDAQGSEGHILRGAGDVLDPGPPLCLELWPHGLEVQGGAGMLFEILKDRYTHFYDLREKSKEAPTIMAIGEIEEFARTIQRKLTEVLVLRLEGKAY